MMSTMRDGGLALAEKRQLFLVHHLGKSTHYCYADAASYSKGKTQRFIQKLNC